MPIDTSFAASGAILLAVACFMGLTISKLRGIEKRLRDVILQRNRSDARFVAIFNQVEAGIAQVDERGNIVLANQKFCDLLGFQWNELRHRTTADLPHPDDREKGCALVHAAFAGHTPGVVEVRYIRKNGTILWTRKSASLLRCNDGSTPLVTVVVVDITERKLAEEILLKREEDLLRAKEAAEVASKAKSQFLANMSHEIRTPLGAVLGFTELLEDPSFGEQERGEFLATIKRNGETLARIVNDVLDLSKVEAGSLQIDLKETALSAVVDDVIGSLLLQAQSRNIAVTSQYSDGFPKRVKTDANRLKQILLNVVGNAIKFTENGKVWVHLKCEPKPLSRTSTLVIDVVDTGIGISPEKQNKLFKPFSQADDSVTRRFGGTGLGITLSRRLANALGGDLVLTSSNCGEGSTFTITVEVEVMAAPSLAPFQGAQPAFHGDALRPHRFDGRRVLVVDDSPDNQLLMNRILRGFGIQVDVAKDGQEGVQKALSHDYDIVLMDIQMPVLDGVEAVRKLRAGGYAQPILALTAHAMKEERDRCLASGFDGYVTKPVDRNELLRQMSAQLLN